VQPLLDAVIDYLPSPLDVPAVLGTELIRGEEEERQVERHADDSEPFAALAFKIAADPTSASSPTSASTRVISRPAPRSSTSAQGAPSGSGAS